MTEKQKRKLQEINESGELFVDIALSLKETPEIIETFRVKLAPYDETDPCDVANDDDVFYYFNGIDELIESFNPNNSSFDFTTLAIVGYYGFTPAFDNNGFQIKRGDKVVYTGQDTNVSEGNYIVFGDPSKYGVNLSSLSSKTIVLPKQCEVDFDTIKINVTNIDWDNDGEYFELPSSIDITISDLVYDYGLSEFSEGEIQDCITNYLSGEYDYLVNGFSFTLDRKIKEHPKHS